MRDPLKFRKQGQPFVATNDKPLTVVAVCVSNEDGSTVGINRCNTAPGPTGLTELICDYFPVPHLERFEIAGAREQVPIEKSFSQTYRLLKTWRRETRIVLRTRVVSCWLSIRSIAS